MHMEWKHDTKEAVPALIAARLEELLAVRAVTWFVSGGSNIGLQTETIRLLADSTYLERLQIMLIDERFGTVGHADSNWQQLRAAGFMIDGPNYSSPFTEAEQSLEQAVSRYEAILADTVESNRYLYAQLGMGSDGHVSGILPHSVAAYSTETFVTGYEAGPYQRLTTTFDFLRRLHEVSLVAYGQDKWPQLNRLEQAINIVEQPVQVLKDIPRVTLYTDYSM